MHDLENTLREPIYQRQLDDGNEVTVWQMIGPQWRLCLGEQGSMYYDNAYCYRDKTVALRAAEQWTGHGDPLDGWHRQPSTGRRRENGDPAKEYKYW